MKEIEKLAEEAFPYQKGTSSFDRMRMIKGFIAGYQNALEAQKKPAMSFLPVLEENLDAMKRYCKTNLPEKAKAENEAVQETLEDLIAIYKAKY